MVLKAVTFGAENTGLEEPSLGLAVSRLLGLSFLAEDQMPFSSYSSSDS